jgi:DNA invertase Pin-like site-specific DNA recombinase
MMLSLARGRNSRMRVVSYARVSTKGQKDRGTSLDDQEKRFSEWLARSGHSRVHKYAEAMSGGKNMQKATFLGMLSDLPDLQVEALVVDSLDRFTRDAYVGIEIVQTLRRDRVNLIELEHGDDPFDFGRDADRDYVLSKFTDAEAERRRIKARQLKRYQQQRGRNATTTNRPSYGLKLEGEERGKRRIVEDEAKSSIVKEVDRLILAGQSQRKVLEWLKSVAPDAWKSRRGLALALFDETGAYVASGVRTPETQAQLRELRGSHRQAYGFDRAKRGSKMQPEELSSADSELREFLGSQERRHELSGLIACGQCVDVGLNPRAALMHGRYIQRNPNPYALVCSGRRGGKTTHKSESHISTHLIFQLLGEKLKKLRNPVVRAMVVERWTKETAVSKSAQQRRVLERRLSALDDDEAEIDSRVNSAVRLMVSDKPGVADEAERLIARANSDRLASLAQREAILSELAALPVPRSRSAEAERLERVAINAELFASGMGLDEDGHVRFDPTVPLREMVKPWIDALGPPVFRRVPRGRSLKLRPRLHWDHLDGDRLARGDRPITKKNLV